MIKRLPGYRFRVHAYDEMGAVDIRSDGKLLLDEVAIDDWLHLEQLDDRVWWMQVGDAKIDIVIPPDGPPEVHIARGEYGPVLGRTEVPEAGAENDNGDA